MWFAKQHSLGRFWVKILGYVMLKRLSSLVLVLVVGGSVMAGTARVRSEHVCKMAGMEMMTGMDTMPGCKEEHTEAATAESGTMVTCCITIPTAPVSSGTTFKLRPPSFSGAVVHPATAQSPVTLPKRFECSYSNEVFLPNLQASYIRNLALLI